ncbi:MAG TPA: hypothetical protein VHT91_13145 [Kofleriaceae bacterium]|jgi:hypothetical protein|nr:hypothetical protein [Kofleriaceae bacterium]
MSDLGKYTFLPWLRQGISTQVAQSDGTPVTGHASVQATVKIGGGPESAPVTVSIDLLGPGDVRAFDTRAITRHWPRPDVFEVEPNYFPLLELFPADIAWRFTPARANAQDRLRPWLGLIALRDDEVDTFRGPTKDLPVAVLTTKAATPLPPVDQLWAWAHVHVDAADNIDLGAMQGLLDNASHQVVARLLCPRRLDQRTTYTAFLVPTLEAARLGALGQTVDPALDVSQPAWKNDGTAVQLPVFYSWRFQTSDSGDFESLARRIVAIPLPATVGERPMDVSQPGMGLPQAASAPLAVESALEALDAQPSPWTAGERQSWTTALGGLLNLADQRLHEAGAPRTLVPPLYGRWYAAQTTLDPAGQPPWFEDLNADPRTRVAAAMGWQVVQNEQQQLLAGAWAQVDAVRAANALLRQAQLAREAAIRLYTRHVLVQPLPALALFTQALHPRVLVAVPSLPAPITVRALVQQSPLRAGVLHPAFVKLARPLGPIGVRQGRALVKTPTTILDRVNTGALPIAPPPPTPTNLVTPGKAGTQIAPPWLTPHLADWLSKLPHSLWLVIELLLEAVLAVWPQFLDPPLRQELVQFLTELQTALKLGGSPADDIKRRIAARDGTLTPAQIHAAPPRPGFVAQAVKPDGTIAPLPASSAPEDPRFRTAVAVAFGNANAAPAPGETLFSLDLGQTAQALRQAIDPVATIGATFRGRLGIVTPWNPPDPLDPVMAAPAFSQPMYKPLYDISPDWILSGFGALPTDMASLGHPNERFIESYMVGANDELGRTLLFNEYPTDQRGSYFRQFWDVTGVQDPEPDINPLAAWPRTAPLGGNSTRPGIDSYLVLIVRAELLRRYPGTIVYAVQAQWNADGTRSIAAGNPVELHPEFRGSLGTGAGFWGFKLTTADARGSDSPSGPAGWYFALQEHSSEPRFGLEPAGASYATSPSSWQQLAWSDLAANPGALGQVQYVDLGTALPHVGAVSDAKHARWHVADGARASDLAYITYREPVRLLVHASRMIPKDA